MRLVNLFVRQKEKWAFFALILSFCKIFYPHNRRVFVRAEYEHIDKQYTDYLLSYYEETFFPDQVSGAGRLVYVARNKVMVDSCSVLVTYCNLGGVSPHQRTKSGTAMATQYAESKKKRIINLCKSQK